MTARDGVTCTNALAAVGIDKQDEAVTRQDCRDKLDFLSPDGARGAYSYVARNSDYGGTPAITRTRVYGDSTTGIVTVYLAGPSGGSSVADVALATTAIVTWCTPICITPVVAAATNVTVPVTYSLWVYKSCGLTSTEVKTAISTALEQMFATVPIGGDVIAPATTGKLYQSDIAATIIRALPEGFRVTVSAPSGDTALTNGQVAVLGTVTGTISRVGPDLMATFPTTFRTSRRRLAPRWLTEGEGGLVGYALDLIKDAYMERVYLGLLARLPETAGTDALGKIGRDRRTLRGLGPETDASYATRSRRG